MKIKLLTVTAASGAVLLSTLAPGGTAVASGFYSGSDDNKVSGRLNPLNNSGVTGDARVKVEGKKLDVRYKAKGLVPNLPHAAHIHYGEQATHECPFVRDDTNRDFRLNVVEGMPRYGPIAVSVSTRGDTGPDSGLAAVDPFSTAPKGTIE